ncbi:hypothetical protein BDV98DRAFT_212137 [Pterulicium gracile]|uniref:F-box domain-containing protein n=1 Tax=Pterulicium gracile TaxID=1884261 RepID=A0A5C3QA16_9AGAR|nr:hypothetical protein BDV98DRAFT_212137 [Pterula gracilis]
MIELPPEMWLEVLQYFPNDLASELYAVNHVFFDYPVDIKYSSLETRFSCKEEWSPHPVSRLPLKVVVGLRDQRARDRVRSVSLRGFDLHQWDIDPVVKRVMTLYARTPGGPLVSRQPRRWLSSVLDPQRSLFIRAAKEVMNHLSALPNLEVLRIDKWACALRK